MPFDKCPQCGYTDVPKPQYAHHTMNYFVNTSSPKEVVVMNRVEDEFTAVRYKDTPKEKTVTWVRQEVYPKWVKEHTTSIPTTVTTTEVPKPNPFAPK